LQSKLLWIASGFVKWEYKVSNAPTTPRDMQLILDHDGTEQWELVSATLIASRMLLLYKRPVEDQAVAESVEETPAVEESVSYQVEESAENELAPVEGTGEEIAS
jgi:hypothetical protein